MTLLSRIQRIERNKGSDDPFASLTDEELQTAIDAVREQIEAAVGMPEADYAQDLSQRLADGTLPDDLDPETVARFVRCLLAEVNGKTRSLVKGGATHV